MTKLDYEFNVIVGELSIEDLQKDCRFMLHYFKDKPSKLFLIWYNKYKKINHTTFKKFTGYYVVSKVNHYIKKYNDLLNLKKKLVEEMEFEMLAKLEQGKYKITEINNLLVKFNLNT